jgi:nucleoside-diphosphate-sugar epimerase
MKIMTGRLFIQIGTGGTNSLAPQEFSRQIAMAEYGLSEPIIYHGNLESRRDISDCMSSAPAMVDLLHKGKFGEAYNVGSGYDVSMKEVLDMLVPEAVTAGALTLVHKDSPNRLILAAGAGGYSSTRLFETEGVFLPPEYQTPEGVEAAFDQINDTSNQEEYLVGSKQGEKFLTKAMAYLAAKSKR